MQLHTWFSHSMSTTCSVVCAVLILACTVYAFDVTTASWCCAPFQFRNNEFITNTKTIKKSKYCAAQTGFNSCVIPIQKIMYNGLTHIPEYIMLIPYNHGSEAATQRSTVMC